MGGNREDMTYAERVREKYLKNLRTKKKERKEKTRIYWNNIQNLEGNSWQLIDIKFNFILQEIISEAIYGNTLMLLLNLLTSPKLLDSIVLI